MRNSVENRSPFMDHRVVEAGFSLSLEEIVCGQSNKHVLKKSKHYRKFKPLLERKKVGFNTPISDSYKQHMLQKLVLSGIFSMGILNERKFLKKLENGMFANNNYDRFLFRLYQVNIWHEIYCTEK